MTTRCTTSPVAFDLILRHLHEGLCAASGGARFSSLGIHTRAQLLQVRPPTSGSDSTARSRDDAVGDSIYGRRRHLGVGTLESSWAFVRVGLAVAGASLVSALRGQTYRYGGGWRVRRRATGQARPAQARVGMPGMSLHGPSGAVDEGAVRCCCDVSDRTVGISVRTLMRAFL